MSHRLLKMCAKNDTLSNKGATASNSVSIIVTEDIAGCAVNFMAVDRIAMNYKAKKGKVKGFVYLLDENGSPVKDATVHGVWTLPNGDTVEQYRKTRNKVRASFGLLADAADPYTLTVVEVTKAGHVFDPDGSNVLEGQITISP